MRIKKRTVRRLLVIELVVLVISLCILFYLLQRYWAHRDGYFVPDYPRVTLTEESDYETIFLQTGLGESAVDKLLEEGNFQAILDAQEAFFNPPEVECTALLGWFTREDKLRDDVSGEGENSSGRDRASGPRLVDLQPGDILLTLSTHSFGWNHGHAALVIDEDTTLECMVLGTDSTYGSVDHWCEYSNYAVLRVKGVTPEQRQAIAEYGATTLLGVPYRLTAGFIGDKAPRPDEWQFGLQCSYLVWYAWNHFGYDLDSDGGRLVSSYDLLHSDNVEIVQIYGMNPEEFIEK
ncbi:MAG: hypothetical protein IJ419_15585 [Agathobacter sp.]|nr:hypothetical protein [Agathobacter sp.]